MKLEWDMPRCVLVGVIVCLSVTSAFAEEFGARFSPSAAAAAVPAPSANMQQVATGDHWTYEIKDEISGAIKQTRTVMVTDVSKNEVATRFDVAKTGQSGNILYDPSWNILRNAVFKFSPNDGTGIHLPLTLGAQWKITVDALNSNTGIVWRRVGNSRVAGQESVTTKAGTFQCFVIETNYVARNTKDPTRASQISARTWFSPDVNHWVKRNIVMRQDGHVFQNNMLELTEYGHKKQ
jgi:hypothetical protein